MTQAEFDKLSIDQRIERIFKPEKYPEFHAFLDELHEAWIRFIRNSASSSSSLSSL